MTMAGMTKGNSVMNSTIGLSCGRRSRIQYAAGTTISTPRTMVKTAATTEYRKVDWKRGSPSTIW